MENNKPQRKSQIPLHMDEFHWAVYGICVGSLLFIFAAIYVITRVVDTNWADWKLPTILVTLWLVITVVTAMFFSLFTIKTEMKKEAEKAKSEKGPSK